MHPFFNSTSVSWLSFHPIVKERSIYGMFFNAVNWMIQHGHLFILLNLYVTVVPVVFLFETTLVSSI